jgi:ABC-type glycerol-3-phosphate transport system substrate-binding protein
LATHWTDYQRAAINHYLEEYMRLHPDIEIEHQNVPFEDYFKKVQISHLSGEAPDIYYEQWMDALREHALFRGGVASFDYLQYYDGLTAMRGAEVGYKRAQTFALPPISRKRGLPLFPTNEPVLIF